jgi:alpha-amylase
MQSLESFVDEWFKPLAYALILLRHHGTPCVFYPALYGAEYTGHRDNEVVSISLSPVLSLPLMLKLRTDFCYGELRDYFDQPNCIGWVWSGNGEMKDSGLAVVLSNGAAAEKRMQMGPEHAGRLMKSATDDSHKIKLDKEGFGMFPVKERSISLWVWDDSLINN